MKTLRLSLRDAPTVEAELALTPRSVVGLSTEEVSDLKVMHGNRETGLVDFFEISGETADQAGDQRIEITGDLAGFKSVGRGMEGGEIVVSGDAGLYAGAEMRGGSLVVDGDVSNWCGAEKAGGKIVVKGGAGAYMGGAYRGSRSGMTSGSIRVDGSVGDECGAWMRGGSIRVRGDAGRMLGIHMDGGSIHVEGDAGRYAGGAMTGGRVIVDGAVDPMATFRRGRDEDVEDEVYQRFLGDSAEGGDGEIMTPRRG